MQTPQWPLAEIYLSIYLSIYLPKLNRKPDLAGPSLLAEARAAYVALTRSRGEMLVLERPAP